MNQTESSQADTGKSSEPQPPFDPATTSSGARFYRADLHVHSFGGSPDVKDNSMTPEALVQRALQEGIQILAITDHNSYTNCAAALAAAADVADQLLVLPGAEITTPDGHVLVIFPPDHLEALSALLTRLDFKSTSDGTITRLRIEQVAEMADEGGGMAMAAHIDREGTGFEMKATYHDRAAIVASPHIVAFEIDDVGHLGWYTDTDKGGDRDKHWQQRCTELGPVVGPRLPKVQFSDAHALANLGRNPKTGVEKITRIKMELLSFEGLRAAFLDPDARIRTEALLPAGYPRLIAARFTGGFLNEQQITFSSSLTCLIGGRGAGKSTALEAIRWACDPDADVSQVGQPHWPQRVDVCVEDEFGSRRWVTREAGFPYPVELAGEGPVRIDLEGYEQDHTASVIRGYRDDPTRLLEFLDQFVDLDQINSGLESVSQRLDENAKVLRPLEAVPEQLKKGRLTLADVKRRIGIVDKSNVREALKWRRLLLQERNLRELIENRMTELPGVLQGLNLGADLAMMAGLAGIEDLSATPSAELLTGNQESIQARLMALAEALATWRASGQQLVDEARTDLATLLEKWKAREVHIERRIETATQALLQQGINPDLKAINALAAAETAAARELQRLETEEVKRQEAATARQSLLGELGQLLNHRFQARELQGQELSRGLKEAIGSFEVGISFLQGGVTRTYEEWLRPALGHRFIRGDRMSGFCLTIGPIALAHLVRENQWNRARQLTDPAGQPYLGTDDEAKEFLACLRAGDLYSLECVTPDDRPAISLTVNHDGQFRTVAFPDLSFGQKSSILLGILLFSKATAPLVIDQPEDHLDSQFIYEAVVGTLRRIKEQRQVIIATHNANIAVLGDAELIVPLRAWQDRGLVHERGSVDTVVTRARACRILEGGETAYRRRGELYGFRFDPAKPG